MPKLHNVCIFLFVSEIICQPSIGLETRCLLHCTRLALMHALSIKRLVARMAQQGRRLMRNSTCRFGQRLSIDLFYTCSVCSNQSTAEDVYPVAHEHSHGMSYWRSKNNQCSEKIWRLLPFTCKIILFISTTSCFKDSAVNQFRCVTNGTFMSQILAKFHTCE